MNPAARKAWAGTEISVWPGRYVLAELGVAEFARAIALVGRAFSAVIVEADAVSLIVEESAWDAAKPAARAVQRGYRIITLNAEVTPDLAGYLAPAAARLAEAGIPIVPVCGAPRDHLLVRDKDLDRARKILEDLARDCTKIAAP